MKNIVIVFVHQDDSAFGMGGTAYLLKDRYKLHVICLNQPEPAVRGREMEAECRALNAGLTGLGLPDPYADKATCEKVAEVMKRLDPVAVFGMWPLDFHPHHSACSEITRRAMHLAGINPEFYMFETGFTDQTVRFDPDIFVDITPVFDNKIELIRLYESQNGNDRLVKRCLTQARMRGQQAHCRSTFYRKEEDISYAEGFKMLRPVTSNRKCILFGLSR